MNNWRFTSLIITLLIFLAIPARSQGISQLEDLVLTEDWYHAAVVAAQLPVKMDSKSRNQYWLLRTRIELSNKRIRFDSIQIWLSRVSENIPIEYKTYLVQLSNALQKKNRIPTDVLETLHKESRKYKWSVELAIYLGENYRLSGNPEKALEIFKPALQACSADSSRYFKKIFHIRAARVLCYRDLQETELAVDESLKALRILERIPYPVYEEQARIYNNLGNVYLPIYFSESERYLKKSVEVREIYIKDTSTLITGYINLGILYLRYAQLELADEVFNKALHFKKGLPNPTAEFNYALLLRETDRIEEAILRLEQVVQPTTCTPIQFRIKSRLANYYYGINNKISGQKYAQFAYQCLTKLGNDPTLYLEYYNDNTISGKLIGDIEFARQYSDSAYQIVEKNPTAMTAVKDFHRERTNLYIELNKEPEADKAYQDYISFFNATGQTPTLLDSLGMDILHGLLLTKFGKFTEARRFYSQLFSRLALNSYIYSFNNELILIYTQAGIASQKLYQKTNEKQYLIESLDYFRQALQYTEVQYASLSGSLNKLNFNKSINDLFGLFVETAAWNPTLSSPNELFSLFEKSKSRTLHTNLKNLKINAFHNVSAALQSKEEKLNKENRILVQSMSQRLGDQHTDRAELSQLQVQLMTLKARKSQFLDSLKKELPDYYSLHYIQDESRLDELQTVLKQQPGTCLLNYLFSQDSAYGLLVSQNQLTLHRLGGRIQIERLLKVFQNQMNHGVTESDTVQTRLYDILIRPFQNNLPLSTQHLVIIPDNTLLTLPFESLIDRHAGTKNKYLVQRYSIRYHYSATLFVQSTLSRKKADHVTTFTGIAPEFGAVTSSYTSIDDGYREVKTSLDLNLPPLPAAREEVSLIASRFTSKNFKTQLQIGSEATEQIFKSRNVGNSKYLHIATHGFIDSDKIDEPGVILGFKAGDTEDGILKASEFYNLRLTADLVVLSACETGQGKLIKGEGIQNLARSVLYAGAPDVVVTLWKVQDQETALVVERFYHYLLKNLPPHQALQKMKQDMIRKGVPVIHWSPLILVGI